MAEGELQAFLSRTSFFGGLLPETVAIVAAMLKEKHVAAGELLFAEGDTGKSMYIVREGALIMQRLCHGTGRTEARLLMMRPGDFFGVTSLIEMEPRPFSCRAEKDSLLLELTNVDLYKLYKSDQKTYILLIQNIARELCRRLRKAGERIAVLEDALHGAAGKPEHE
ncbi:MAG TPA: Crp/Fnr family transcriptional regulator [Myxococcales bacterium]|nr:Crp/Fnr family transcriptional regulator [Myxococcales bacterium]